MGRRTRILLSIYVGFVTYCLVVLLFGRTGVVASVELHDYRTRLETNLSNLETINKQLAEHFDALRSSPETIRLEARQLGFLGSNERVLQVSNYHPPVHSFTVGSLVFAGKHAATSDSSSRMLGFAAACITFILSSLIARRRRGPRIR